MSTLSRDTTEEARAGARAEQLQLALLRSTPIWRKLQMVEELNQATRELAMGGLRRRFPQASPQELHRRLADLLLGKELAEKVCDIARAPQWTLLVVALLAAASATAAQTALPEFSPNLTRALRSLLDDGRKRLLAGDKPGAVRRFELFERKPTPVFVNVTSVPKSVRASYREATLAGLRSWNEACPELVEFRATENEDESALALVFETSVANQNNAQLRLVCGETHAFAELDAQRHPARWKAEVRLAIYPHGRSGHLHAAANVTHVVAHELGHYLGLEDSSAPEDIMSPDEHNKPCSLKPSENEAKFYRAFRDALSQWVEAARK